MPDRNLIVFSECPEDIRFFAGIATAVKSRFTPVLSLQALKAALLKDSNCIVLVDLDHSASSTPDHPASAAAIIGGLQGVLSPNQVFALVSQRVNRIPYLSGQTFFGNFILRKYDHFAEGFYAALFQDHFSASLPGMRSFFARNTPPLSVKVSESSQRREVVDQLRVFWMNHGMGERIANLATMALDELMMNAIFDAPRHPGGERYRMDLDRTAEFKLNPGESVSVEAFCSDMFAGMSVSDNFGSLSRDRVITFISKCYAQDSYVVPAVDVGAGLGLYRIFESGLSILFLYHPEVKTEVTVFFPLLKSMKELKQGFQFLGILELGTSQALAGSFLSR